MESVDEKGSGLNGRELMATYRYCDKCNKKFQVQHRGQRYCSNKCQNGIPYHRRKYKCKICGKFYRPTTRRTSYHCSNECASEHYKRYSRFAILERDNFTCFYCGRSSFEDSAELHLDHLVPFSKGGKGIAGNLVTACRKCNLEKYTTRLTNEDQYLEVIRKRNAARNISNDLRIEDMK